MRERAKGLIGRGAKEVLICTFHALGVRMMRQDGAVLGLKPQFSILDSDDVTSILKDCGGTVDAATARQWQWTISLWKNTGLNAAQALAQAKDDSERVTATHHGALRRAAERLPERRLRRPDRPAAQAAGRVPGRARQSGRRRWAMCWWTNTRTPTPRSTRCSSSLVGERGALHRRGRRRPVDLRLARRHAGQPEAPAAGLSRSSRSSSWSRTTAPPAPSCARPTT